MSILDSIRKSLSIRTDSDFIRNLDRECRIYDRESGIYDGDGTEFAYLNDCFEELSFNDLMPLGVF